MALYTYKISEDEAEERLDRQLSILLPEQSRTYLAKLIKNGDVKVNDKLVKPSYVLRENDTVLVEIPEAVAPEITPENIPLDVLYEDEDVIVVNKPKGMVVHPAAGHMSGTLVNAVMYHCGSSLSGINGVLRPGIVHRIDRDTTGSIIICKNDEAHRSIAAQLKEHSITRKYYAILCGNPKSDDFVIDKNIGRDAKDRKKMAVVSAPSGKHAVTHCHILERYGEFSLAECVLETGRTHQIRVHLASEGYPLLGDSVYGGARKGAYAALEGQCLHAGVLGFIHPSTGAYIETKAPLPAYFESLLRKFRNHA